MAPDSLNSIKSTLLSSLVDSELNNVLNKEDAAGKETDALSVALEYAQNQELHDISMAQEREKARGLVLKNDQAVQKIEIEKAKAIAQGLAIGSQEPSGNPTPQEPASGKGVSDLLNASNINLSQGLLNAVDRRLNTLRETGQRGVDPAVRDTDKWLRDQLIATLSRVDSEKHLQYGPLGQAGSVVGGLLDIVSGPLDIGTEIFGGKLPAAAQAELFSRAIAQTSPLLRAEMNDIFNRDRLEMSASAKLGKRGLSRISPMLRSDSDIEGADEIAAMAIDMRQLLADSVETKDHFSSDSSTGIGQAFNMFEDMQRLVYELEGASTKEEVINIAQQMAETDSSMRDIIQQFYNNGGTPEQLHSLVVNSVDLINKNFQQKLEAIPGDSKATEFQARRKLVAQDLTNKLSDFLTVVSSNVTLDLKEARVKKLGQEFVDVSEDVKDKFEGVYTRQVKTSYGRRGDYEEIKPAQADDIAKAITADVDNLIPALNSLMMTEETFDKLANAIIIRHKGGNAKDIQTILEKYKKDRSKATGNLKWRAK